MSGRWWVCGVMVLASVACTLGPDYQRPVLELPKEHRGVEVPAGEAADLADTAWWELFGDPVLDELIQTALHQNRDLLIAAARVEEIRARFRVTHSNRLPAIGAAFNADREKESGDTSSSTDPVNTFALEVGVRWEADLWGRLRRGDEAARADLLSTEEARRGVILSLVADVARAYFELRDIDQRLSMAEATVGSRSYSLEIAELRFEGGLTSQLEVRQAETELAKAEVLVPELEQARAEKEHELSLLLGSSPGGIMRGNELGLQNVPPEVPAGLPSELLERRPDIRGAEQDLVAANADVGVAVAGLYPRLALTATAGSESNDLDRVLASGTGIWELAAGLTAPLWQGGRLRADVAAARARFEQQVLTYDQTILVALGEVADALAATRSTKSALLSQERLELASRQYLELASLQYANGVVAYLDVLDAQRQLFSAELDLSTATRNRLLAVVELYRALGGGWSVAEERAQIAEEPS